MTARSRYKRGMPKLLPFFIWAFIGFGLLAGSAYFFWRDHAFAKRSIPGQGTVVSTSSDRHSSTGERYYRAVVAWTDRDGRAHEYEVHSSNSGTYSQGDVVEFRYDPDNPNDRRSGSRMVGLILGFMGVVFIGILIRMIFLP